MLCLLYTADSLPDTRSTFNSVTSLLAGISLDQGYLHSVRQWTLEQEQ